MTTQRHVVDLGPGGSIEVVLEDVDVFELSDRQLRRFFQVIDAVRALGIAERVRRSTGHEPQLRTDADRSSPVAAAEQTTDEETVYSAGYWGHEFPSTVTPDAVLLVAFGEGQAKRAEELAAADAREAERQAAVAAADPEPPVPEAAAVPGGSVGAQRRAAGEARKAGQRATGSRGGPGYDRETKLRALAIAADRGVPAAADEIGVSQASIYSWRTALKGVGLPAAPPAPGSVEETWTGPTARCGRCEQVVRVEERHQAELRPGEAALLDHLRECPALGSGAAAAS